MTYGKIRRAVLERLNQYSIAGEVISPAYNHQSDALGRIPNLINHALVDIRTGVKPRQGIHRWKQDLNGWAQHTLPADFWRMRSGSLRRVEKDGPPEPVKDFRLIGNRLIWTPPGEYLLEYDRYPEQLPENPPDGYDLREEPDVLCAAYLYAAAGLVMMEDETAFAALSNEYESRKAAMMPSVTAEILPVMDAYRFGYAEG